MIKKNSLKFQFVMLLAIEVILWSVFSELFWLLIEKIFDQKIADGTSGGLEIPDFWIIHILNPKILSYICIPKPFPFIIFMHQIFNMITPFNQYR